MAGGERDPEKAIWPGTPGGGGGSAEKNVELNFWGPAFSSFIASRSKRRGVSGRKKSWFWSGVCPLMLRRLFGRQVGLEHSSGNLGRGGSR